MVDLQLLEILLFGDSLFYVLYLLDSATVS